MSPPIDLAAIKARLLSAQRGTFGPDYDVAAINYDVPMLVAEVERLREATEWRSDEPPMDPVTTGVYRSGTIEVYHYQSTTPNCAVVHRIGRVSKSDGNSDDEYPYYEVYAHGYGHALGRLGIDWRWRPVGSGPFNQEPK